VGIDPHEAYGLVLIAEVLGDTSHGAGRNGVVAAKDDWGRMVNKRLVDALGHALGAVGYFIEERDAVVAAALGLGHRDRDVATVSDAVAQRFELGLQPGYTKRGRAHIDTAAALAKIEWNADDFDLLREG